MRSVKSAILLLGGATLAANLVLACSGDDGRTAFVEPPNEDGGRAPSLPGTSTAPAPTGTNPTPDPTPTKDSGVDAGDDAGADADSGAGDTTIADGGDEDVSVLPPGDDAGATGSPCSPTDSIQEQSCGLCGVQYRLCAPSSDEPGAPSVWQEWGYCQNELVDGCVPGTVTTEACGLCGTRQKVCQNDCRYAAGACKNEPENACTPGTVDYQEGLSCTEGGRSRTCQDNCTYSAFGDCFTPGEPDVPELIVSPTVGEKVVGDFVLTSDEQLPRLSGTCPNADTDNDERPSNWIRLVNQTASAVKVTVWTMKSTKPGATTIDTVIASYGKTFPSTPAKREACVSGVVDGCADGAAGDPTSCLNSWAALYDSDAVSIGANSHAYIWVGGYFADDTGDYQLAVRTDVVN